MPNYDVFLACPISGSTDVPGVALGRDLAESLASALRGFGLSVFFAGCKLEQGKEVCPPDFSLNLASVKDSAVFVLITAEHEVSRSSIWIEAGMAFALEIPSIFVAPGLNSLPILVQRALEPIAEGGQRGAVGLWFTSTIGCSAVVDFLLPRLLIHLQPLQEVTNKWNGGAEFIPV
ncbi:MAG: hypothetical protein ABL869_03920 [Candidatus Nitrotoga sp.]